jgi:hypothetical protein
MMVGCAAAQSHEEGDDGEFFHEISFVNNLGGNAVSISNSFAFYVSSDGGEQWKAVYVLSPKSADAHRIKGVGGGPESAYFLLQTDDKEHGLTPIGEALMKWSPKEGVTEVGKLPPFIDCRFATEQRGAYIHGRHVFLTDNGGVDWKELEAMPKLQNPPADTDREFDVHGKPNANFRALVRWATPSQLAVVCAGSLAVYDIDPKGDAHRRWVKQLTDYDEGIDGIKAVGNGEIWLSMNVSTDAHPNAMAMQMFKIDDGSAIDEKGDWSTDDDYYLKEGSVLVLVSRVGGTTVKRYELMKGSVRLTQSVAIGGKAWVNPLKKNDFLILATTGSQCGLYRWDGESKEAKKFDPQIDNAVIRRDYWGPDYVSKALLKEMVDWMGRAGQETSTRIVEAADGHTEMGMVDQTKWIIEQCKIAVAHNGQWTAPPASQPAK